MSEADTGLRARLIEVGVDLGVHGGRAGSDPAGDRPSRGRLPRCSAPRLPDPSGTALRHRAPLGFADLGARATGGAGRRSGESPRPAHDAGEGLSRLGLTQPGMYELMFRQRFLGERETGAPGNRCSSCSVSWWTWSAGHVPRPTPRSSRAPSGRTCTGSPQLWGWGSLPLATGATDFVPLLDAALDAHLGPEER